MAQPADTGPFCRRPGKIMFQKGHIKDGSNAPG